MLLGEVWIKKMDEFNKPPEKFDKGLYSPFFYLDNGAYFFFTVSVFFINDVY